MSKPHTPGPWSRYGVFAHIEIRSADGALIAVVGSDELRSDRSANARLIATAPDLLEALTNLRANMLAQDLENEGERPNEEEYQRCMRSAADAIAKATGSAP